MRLLTPGGSSAALPRSSLPSPNTIGGEVFLAEPALARVGTSPAWH